MPNLCTILHQLVPALEIMADHEGGPVSQLAAAVGRPPAAWSLGVLDDPGLTGRVFETTGRRLAAAGIDRVLAPVADVLTEPRNPVIGARAFGPDAALATRHTVAAVTGLLAGGVGVCLKHWPGHGGSREDSHHTEARIGGGAVPAPFEGGLRAGADAVMVGHLHVGDRREGSAAPPVTLDGGFLAESRDRLEEWGGAKLSFFADDVTMGALGPAMDRLGVPVPAGGEGNLFDPASLPLAWFERLADAGCDRLLIRGIPQAAFPLDEVPAHPVPAGEDSGEVPSFTDEGAYQEARRLLWNRETVGFPAAGADLLWVDHSRHDRWEAAAGRPGESALDLVEIKLSRMFRRVIPASAASTGAEPWNRLLVTSHRPLPAPETLPEGLATVGVCLVMGHPALKDQVAGLLGRRWRVGALYDIAPEDLWEGP